MEGVIEYLSQTPLWTLRTQSLDVFLVLVFFWFYGFLNRTWDDLTEINVYSKVIRTQIRELGSVITTTDSYGTKEPTRTGRCRTEYL
jgi:hypothetical protein